MKNIGIKLADGTFYPVLQDNVPSEKALKLTTANNNQTKVMVDLYRSETDSMEDAEYVDSLQIENLVAHPNGEPDIAFSVSLDEENELSAKIVDEETGKQSNTTITLVSRTIEERLYTDEYDIKELEPQTKRKGLLAAASALVGAGAVASAVAAEKETPAVVEDEPSVEEEPVVVVEEEAPTDEETFVEEPSLDEFAISEEPGDESATIADEPLPDFEETAVFEETPAAVEDEPLPDFNFDSIIDEPAESAESEEVTENTEAEEEDALPDFDETPVVEETALPDEPVTEDSELDLPDFGDIPGLSDDPVTDEVETAAEEPAEDPLFTPDENIADIDIDFTVPVTPLAANSLDSYEFNIDKDENLDLNDMDLDFDFPDIDEKSEEVGEEVMSKKSYTESHSNGGISFTGLYDKETELGTSATTDDGSSKKTKAPVIICIICAIICLLATAFVLLVVPSKFNLLGKTGENDTVAVQPVEEPTPSPEPVVEPEPEPEVEEIVIIEKAEEVIPEQPPVAVEKPKDITYKIKWGDTLWDISDTYYKNPWRYKYIARFNGIKDPDYIISGTYITIPAE